MNAISNPFSQMLVSCVPDSFFGRREDIEIILRGVSSREPRSFAIDGIRTIGKTSLLKYLCDPEGAITEHERVLVEYGPNRTRKLEFRYIDFYGIDGVAVLHTLSQGLLGSEEIRRPVNAPLTVKTGRGDAVEAYQALRDHFRARCNEDVRLVICMDHLDTALKTIADADGDEFRLRHLTNYVSFVIATEGPLAELKQDRLITSPFLNLFTVRNVGLLTEPEAKELIAIPSEDAKKPFGENEVGFLLKAAGCQPYLLTIVCEFYFSLRSQYPNVKDLLSKEEVQQRVMLQMEALPAVTELFDLYWNRLVKSEHEKRTLLKIASGQEPDLDREWPALNTLRQKALIHEDLQGRKHHVFSELFRNYVLRQGRPHRRKSIEDIIESLAPLDRKLFEYFSKHPNEVCTFDELLAGVWEDPNTSKRALEAAIHRLRTRIQDVDGAGREYIQNVRGKGYQYVPKQT